eukprot:TRINITY_DN5775_c0_g1_i1.p1 TRINITY_DN5775_c0_g1~~TRINITY_DN5775_c0_g1_i1.p1  ORF type:complete len:492 (-),score=72.39 TRINITY_DN5775_c0_g1_i1:147-1622(-)
MDQQVKTPSPKKKPIGLKVGSSESILAAFEANETKVRAGRTRGVSWCATPRKEKTSDRFIPFRSEAKDTQGLFELSDEQFTTASSLENLDATSPEEQNQLKYESLLNVGLLGLDPENALPSKGPRLLKFQRTQTKRSALVPTHVLPLANVPMRTARVISKAPFKVLDAPELKDDFYLNLMDWSSTNYLTVSLGVSIYLWSADTGRVERLCQVGGGRNISFSDENDFYTALRWDPQGMYLATGRASGVLELWDLEKGRRIVADPQHKGRLACLAWNPAHPYLLASGSRDSRILLWDLRAPYRRVHEMLGHRLEVCGLSFAPHESTRLASGGNDNHVLLWSLANPKDPEFLLAGHTAAVKGVAWSPHQRGMLATGGGTRDTSLKMWNTISGALVSQVKTHSQICSIVFSSTVNELATAHGYVNNDIVLWKAPSLTRVASLEGHESRVLYLALSPKGQLLASGAADETIKLWEAFPMKKTPESSPLSTRNFVLR